jgi:hypothetical protein
MKMTRTPSKVAHKSVKGLFWDLAILVKSDAVTVSR